MGNLRIHRPPNVRVQWPSPMGDNYREVFETWIERAENLTWFLMGRSLLQLVTTGELANKDTDIDIACLRSDALTVKELFADWPVGFELYEKDVTHQLCYYPQRDP